MSDDIQDQGAGPASGVDAADHYPYYPGGQPAWPTSTWQHRADTSRDRELESNRAKIARRDTKQMLAREASGVSGGGRERTIEMMRRRG